MMKKRPYTYSITFFVIVAAAVCVWLLFAAPVFQDKEKQARSENAALVKDIVEIEAMDGSAEALDKLIADTKSSIKQQYTAREDTAEAAYALIESICAGLGHSASKTAVGQRALLHPAGAFVPALYAVDITFLVESAEQSGASIIRALENHKSADFEVTSFVYRVIRPEKDPEEDPEDEEADEEAVYSGEWIFSVTLYYYEEYPV